MKQAIAFVIISIFFLNSLGAIWVYKVLQLEVTYEIKAHLKSSIAPDRLVKIKVSKKPSDALEWSWFGLDDEFKCQGQIDQLVIEHLAQSKKVKTIKNLIAKKIFINPVTSRIKENSPTVCRKHRMNYVKSSQRIFLDIIVPPPQTSA